MRFTPTPESPAREGGDERQKNPERKPKSNGFTPVVWGFTIARYLKTIGIFSILIVFLGYAYLRAENLVRGPQIIIDTPIDGETSKESLVSITGKIKNASAITLNGRSIYTDEAQNINEVLLLTYGYNVIEIRAQDKFGRERIKTLELVYK